MSIRQTPFFAIAAILCADLILTFNDALVKQAQDTFSLWAVFWMRAMVAVPLLILLAWRSGVIPQAFGLVVLRSLLLAASWVTLYSAFDYMPISTAVAIASSNPILIAVLTAALDRQALPLRVWGAIALGFLGALMIVQPHMGGTFWAYGLPFTCAATYACAMVMTGRRLGAEAPATLSLWLNLAFMGVGAVGMVWIGDAVAATTVAGFAQMPGTLITMGIIVAMAAILVAFAFQNASAPLVGVFDYSYLLFAVLWGYVFFDEIPNALAALGMVCIACAGAITLWVRTPNRT